MLAFLSLIITLLCFVRQGLSLSHSKAHHHRGLTNAQRFARGLPPAPPKRFFGSRSESARRSSVSAIPGQVVSGVIQLTSGGTTYYFTDDCSVTAEIASAVSVQYIDPASSTTPVTMEELNGLNEPAGIYFAFTGSQSNTLSSATTNYAFCIGAVGQTPAGSQPTSTPLDGGGSADVETSFFIIDPTTGDITTTWINPGGAAATDIVVGTNGVEFYMGSGTAYLAPNYVTVVDSITFVPTPP